MSAEQFNQFMQSIQAMYQGAASQAAQTSGLGGGAGPTLSERTKIVARNVRIETFKRNAQDWEDWSFTFKRTIRSMSVETCRTMVEVEKITDDLNELADLTKAQKQRSGELYDVLCQFCTGEALSMIKTG